MYSGTRKDLFQPACRRSYVCKSGKVLVQINSDKILINLKPFNMKNTNNSLDFTGQNIYVGMDVHKRTWTCTICSQHAILKKVVFERPFTKNLVNYLRRNFPNANCYSAYEAGFCGFVAQKELKAEGVNCIVVNPADIPVSDKEKQFKTDLRDSKKIAVTLRSGELKAIYVPTLENQKDRAVVRERWSISKDQTRAKNQIKSHLNFFDIEIPEDFTSRYWSIKFVDWLLKIAEEKQDDALKVKIQKHIILRTHQLWATRELRKLSRTDRHIELSKNLLTVPGVGLFHAMVFLTELIDMKRFKNENHLFSFCGLIPTTNTSADKQRIGEMTRRGNTRVTTALIKSAWVAIRSDNELLMRYETYRKRMNGNKAIIKIAKTLVRRIRKVWIHKEKYIKAEC